MTTVKTTKHSIAGRRSDHRRRRYTDPHGVRNTRNKRMMALSAELNTSHDTNCLNKRNKKSRRYILLAIAAVCGCSRNGKKRSKCKKKRQCVPCCVL